MKIKSIKIEKLYGKISTTSTGTILRKVIELQQQGADALRALQACVQLGEGVSDTDVLQALQTLQEAANNKG